MNQNIINIHNNILKEKTCPFCNIKLILKKTEKGLVYSLDCPKHIIVTYFNTKNNWILNNNWIFLHKLQIYIDANDIKLAHFTGTSFEELINYINKIETFQ